MSIVAYTDIETHELLDDALEQLARHREISLTSGHGILSVLASLRQQLNQMIEQAIAESDLGHDLTTDDIADLLDLTKAEAQHRYNPTEQPN
jgi:CRP-like cAMP-binding protein